MEVTETTLPGCYVVKCDVMDDERGRFVKTYHDARFTELALRTDWREEYYSVSARGVLMGMKFHVPPADHTKLVHCVAGEALDVLVDLRIGSPTCGRGVSQLLSAEDGISVYIHSGLAHGFLALGDESIMQYTVTSAHSDGRDSWILWNSLAFDWPIREPLLSHRDARHPRLEEFQSPFTYVGGTP